MTAPDRTGLTRECGADVAAYALGALDVAEAETFRRHLDTCVVCRDELASFEQVVGILPMSTPPHAVPKGLRRRVLAEVGREAVQRAGAPRRRSWRPRPSWAIPRPALALGAAVAGAAAVVIAVGGTELGSSGAGRTQVFHARVIGTPGSAEVRLAGGHADLVVHHLAPPPAGQIYEVWLTRPHQKPQPTSALFSPTTSGDGDVDVPGNLHGVQQVMVTPEPAGGSKHPTHPAVITAQLT